VFLPRVMRPLPTASRLPNPNVQRIAEVPLSLVRGPPGSYVAERLAAAIQGWDRWQGCVWLRTGGAPPAALAESLVSACLHRWTGDHRDDPSPVSNARLDETMRLSPAGAVVVLELDGWRVACRGHRRRSRHVPQCAIDARPAHRQPARPVQPRPAGGASDVRCHGLLAPSARNRRGPGVGVTAVGCPARKRLGMAPPDLGAIAGASSEGQHRSPPPTLPGRSDRESSSPGRRPHRTSAGDRRSSAPRTFELRVDGRTVEKWTGQRGTSVLRYLLSRRRHTCSRDELLDAFWPEVAPEVARNRLQVAVSGLRRALREVTNLHVIEYAEGNYRINPELQVDVTSRASRRRCRRPVAPSGPVISTAH
jgi:DNA-binding winged helix-turn-helix (wHTH) protein